MDAVELLQLMKRRYKYEELSQKTKLPVVILNRYVCGRVLPGAERAKDIIKLLEGGLDIKNELKERIRFESGYLDNTKILNDILLMKRIAKTVKDAFGEIEVNKVITAAVDGIPVAVPIAQEFGCDLLIAKKEREVGVSKFLEETYAPSGFTMSLYIPSEMIRKADNVLIVDDVLRSGETQRALIRLVKKRKAKVAGIFVLISIGKGGIEAMRKEVDSPMKILLELPGPKSVRY
jgi:adenine phosphoribosyltransferase